eukprot:3188702-Pleurochrysis_carterae.AAC.1
MPRRLAAEFCAACDAAASRVTSMWTRPLRAAAALPRLTPLRRRRVGLHREYLGASRRLRRRRPP